MKHFICIIGVLGLFFSCNTKKDISLEELTISQIHEAYKNGDYTAEDLVRAYIYRIEENDSAINSISEINPVAIGRARALDAEFAATGNLRPLHGIPVIVKDNINTIGLPTSAGALALKDFYPETDAFIIQKLEEAGAIVLAK
ncbi:MAG TPA: amidase, partial [Algoriphagus sp.]